MSEVDPQPERRAFSTICDRLIEFVFVRVALRAL